VGTPPASKSHRSPLYYYKTCTISYTLSSFFSPSRLTTKLPGFLTFAFGRDPSLAPPRSRPDSGDEGLGRIGKLSSCSPSRSITPLSKNVDNERSFSRSYYPGGSVMSGHACQNPTSSDALWTVGDGAQHMTALASHPRRRGFLSSPHARPAIPEMSQPDAIA